MTQPNWYTTPPAGHALHGQSLVVDEGTGATVALIYGVRPADDALIAAAPAMLAALEMAFRLLSKIDDITLTDCHPDEHNAACDAAQAAIAQAKGEQA